MEKLIPSVRQISSMARQTYSRGVRRFNLRAVAFHCALVSLLIFGGIVAVQGQQPDALTITKDGNVGIGKTPDANVRLDVVGDIQITDKSKINLAGENHGLRYRNFGNDDTDGPVLYGWSGGALGFYRPNKADQKIVLRWNDAGNVGIGQQTPTANLSVRGGERLVQISGEYSSTGNERDFTIYFPADSLINNVRQAGVQPGDLVEMFGIRREVESVESYGIRVKGTGITKGGRGPLYVVRGTADPIFRVDDYRGNSVLLSSNDGNVGIGTNNPQFGKLQVAGAATPALRLDANSGVAAMSIGGTGELLVDAVGVTGGRFIVKDNGNVGIGTNTPTQAKLVVTGGHNAAPLLPDTISYFSNQDGGHFVGRWDARAAFDRGFIGHTVSIYASDNIWSGYSFVSSSDERIKNIQGRSDSATDLRTLLGIEITDYRYKDVIGKGNDSYKKVIGQQVEKVFPQAVSKHTDVVPDIYRQASIQDGWVTLTTDLKKGERVKLITQKGEEGIYEVLEVAPDNSAPTSSRRKQGFRLMAVK
jgi:hypothetical protein